jgi:beta-aspartyl-dipeptidase (metallo-type)
MDVGSPHRLGETLKALLDRGIDLASVLPAFTSNVANLLRLRDKGSVGVGFAADFIVLDNAHEIRDVMLGGVWHVADGEQKVFGQFETEDNS